MRSRNLIAFASALAMIGSLAAAVPASAATAYKTVSLPETADRYIVQRSSNGGETFSAQNSARALTNTTNQTLEFGVKAPYTDEKTGTSYVCRVEKATIDISALSDNDPETSITLGNTNSIYIPFGEELAVTKVEIESSSCPYIIALVKSTDINNNNADVVNNGESVLPIISSDNWYRINNTDSKIDANYTLTKSSDNTTSSIELNEGGTAVEYAGVFIDNNNNSRRDSIIKELKVTYAVEVDDPTVSIVDGSVVTENGTGDSESEVATGFIAEIKTTADSAAASALGVKVGDMDKGTKTITPVSGGASAWYKVIVKNISSADNVTVYVQ